VGGGRGQEQRSIHTDSIRIELETDIGCTAVEGAVFRAVRG
jgi:hypothetical protein